MNVGYNLHMQEVKAIIIKHLNETKGIYIPEKDSEILVLDKEDKFINGEIIQVFHEI